MERREFIALVGGAAGVWPLVVRAQQPALPVVGFLHPGSPITSAIPATAFSKGLSETGYVDQKNVEIEYRWGEGQYDRLPALAADLVRRRVAVILGGSPPAAVAAKAATTTIPIVFVSGADPVESGLVASLSHPGGNVTGVAVFTGQLAAKQLGLLRELLPKAVAVTMLVNPKNPLTEAVIRDLKTAAALTGHQIQIVKASNEEEIDKAFAALNELPTDALIVAADPYFFNRRDQFATLAAQRAVPAFYESREFAVSGGLMSYGASLPDGYRRAGIYVGQILKGAKPADLPVLQPTKFELVINLKTAKELGITLSPG
jgi:putative ABC transport system substrate-binding protein